MNKFINDCLTEHDNRTYSLPRSLLAFSTIVYLLLSTMDVMQTKEFEYEHFGIGLAAILAAGNAGVAFQSKSEAKK